MIEPRVVIDHRQCKNGRTTYHLRWTCPVEHIRKGRKVGNDIKHAQAEAALLRRELREGTYKAVKRTGWQTFADDHCRKIPGLRHRRATRHTLDEFGKLCSVQQPGKVRFTDVELYQADLRDRGIQVRTRNKKMRLLHHALRMSVKRGLAATDAMDGWKLEREPTPEPRVIDDAEEKAILDAAKARYGYRTWAVIYVALQTAARVGELLSLGWDRIDFDRGLIHLVKTKSLKDRAIPITDQTVAILRRVQAQTLKLAGPFAGLDIAHRWVRLRNFANLPDVKLHDLRRTAITRLINAGVPPKTVQEIAGHVELTTTMKYYTAVTEDDKRAAIGKLRRVSAG